MVLASASRASFAVLLIGIGSFLIPVLSLVKAIKALFLFLVLFCVMFFVFYDQAVEYFDFERLLNMNDTRVATKEIFWDAFVSSPVFGVGIFTESTANSYYVVLTKGGVVGAIIFFGVVSVTWMKLLARKEYIFIDYDFRCFCSLFLMLTAGGFYEGYLVDNFSFTSVFYVMLIGIISHRNMGIR